jgi:hypothetical protein
MNNIIFTNIFGFNFFPPKPAIKEVPEWYKNTPEYVGEYGKKIIDPNQTPHTIKKCVPIFDAMTAGYILYTQVDVEVSQVDDSPYYNWPSQNAIAFHPIEQAPLHPKKNEEAYPKWMNPYAIKTPPGYSVLITPPMHNPNKIFTILEGVVDTDKYSSPINFPFILNNVKWEGIIEAGTPMAQVIPFKRESWKHSIGSEKDLIDANLVVAKLKSLLFNSYKKQFWSRKEYR